MSLGCRKLIVLGLVAAVILLGNVWLLASWLQEHGIIDAAQHVRREYLTGTAVTIIVVLLILLVRANTDRTGWLRRCSVCDHVLISRGRYCTDCGSKES